MIRHYRETELEEMVNIWYEASIIAHPVIPASFWAFQRREMKEKYLPLAKNLVFEEEGKIMGFISLVGEKVCALFVAPEQQNKGIGKALLEYAKIQKEGLSLKVYKENKKALVFYEKCGFVVIEEEIDEYTGSAQILMEWNKSRV